MWRIILILYMQTTQFQNESAVDAVTADDHKRRLLYSIAFHESGHREDIAICKKLGTAGEKTAWQILERPSERGRLCKTREGDARVALERLEESLRACAHLKPEWRLAVYTRGNCNSVEGRRLSEIRYVP